MSEEYGRLEQMIWDVAEANDPRRLANYLLAQVFLLHEAAERQQFAAVGHDYEVEKDVE